MLLLVKQESNGLLLFLHHQATAVIEGSGKAEGIHSRLDPMLGKFRLIVLLTLQFSENIKQNHLQKITSVYYTSNEKCPETDGPEAIKFFAEVQDVITQGKEVPIMTRRGK